MYATFASSFLSHLLAIGGLDVSLYMHKNIFTWLKNEIG
jgi:hypothetical protein